jgi:hypothetical protein
MDAVREYRDDGPLAVAAGGVAGAAGAHRLGLGLTGALALAIGCALGLERGSAAPPYIGGGAFLLLGCLGARPTVGRLTWLLPPSLRAGEYGFALTVGLLAGGTALPSVFALLAAVAFHHYDLVYRIRHQSAPPPRWVRLLGGGWEGRTLLLALFSITGTLTSGAAVLAVLLGGLFTVESVASWIARVRRTPERI